MALYYVNKNAQSNGDHEVHKDGCVFMPLLLNRLYLGNFIPTVKLLKKQRKLMLNLMVVELVQINVIKFNQ